MVVITHLQQCARRRKSRPPVVGKMAIRYPGAIFCHQGAMFIKLVDSRLTPVHHSNKTCSSAANHPKSSYFDPHLKSGTRSEIVSQEVGEFEIPKWCSI
jgi:hypothetical protein